MPEAASKALTCPSCGEAIDRGHFKERVCRSCNADFDLAISYQRYIAFLTFAAMVVIGMTTHKSSADGSWLLGILLAAIPIWMIFVVFVPPWLQKGHNQPRITIVSSFLAMALTMFLVEFLGFGTLNVLLASARERQEYLEMLSLPLVWISPNFLITANTGFLHLCGVLLGNSLFFGLLLFASYQVVRWAFNRSRPTRLSISGSSSLDNDE